MDDEAKRPLGLTPDLIFKAGSVAVVGGAVLALELTNHAPQGTFITLVAAPVLATMGIHMAAKNLT